MKANAGEVYTVYNQYLKRSDDGADARRRPL